MQILFRKGAGGLLDQYVGKEGEVVLDSDNKTIRMFNGVTPGGFKATLSEQQIYNLSRRANNLEGLVNNNLDTATLLATAGISFDAEKGHWHNNDVMLPDPFESERIWTHANWPNDTYLYIVTKGATNNDPPQMYDYPEGGAYHSSSTIYSSSYSNMKAFNRARTSIANGYLSSSPGSTSSIRQITYNTNFIPVTPDAIYVQGLRLISDGWYMTSFWIQAFNIGTNAWDNLATYSGGTNTHVNPGRLYKLTEAQKAKQYRAFRVAAYSGHCAVARFDLLMNIPVS